MSTYVHPYIGMSIATTGTLKLWSVFDILLMGYPQAHTVNKLWRKRTRHCMNTALKIGHIFVIPFFEN